MASNHAGHRSRPSLGGRQVRLSNDIFMADAGATGFRPEILEKSELLLSLLQGVADDSFLGPRLVLNRRHRTQPVRVRRSSAFAGCRRELHRSC